MFERTPITPVAWSGDGLRLLAARVEEGATALFAGNAVHEWVHDGRHLLGFPCH